MKETLAILVVLVALCVVATVVGAWRVEKGDGLVVAALFGAFVAVALFMGVGVFYRLWARVFWGAPFTVGDVVRVASGSHAGQLGRVIALGQGSEVKVELEREGGTVTEVFPWGLLRKHSPGSE